MSFTHSFIGYRPPVRYDGDPWTQVRVQESATEGGAYTTIDTLALTPVDADPTTPALRNVTTDDATLESGWFRLVFLDAGGQASPATDPVLSPGSADGYPTRDALLAASSVLELTDATDDVADGLRAEAIVAIEAYTGQSFVAEGTVDDPVAKAIDGGGSDVLYLPARLETLLTVSHNGLALNLIDVTVAEDRLVLVSPSDGGSWVTRVRRSAGDPGPSWTLGRSNVVVSGVWGYSQCPAAVATALRFHMEDQALANANAMAPSIRSVRALGLSSIRQGNLNASLQSTEGELSARARRQLADLVWEGGGGFAV